MPHDKFQEESIGGVSLLYQIYSSGEHCLSESSLRCELNGQLRSERKLPNEILVTHVPQPPKICYLEEWDGRNMELTLVKP